MPDTLRAMPRWPVASLLTAGVLWLAGVVPSAAQALPEGLLYTAVTPCRIADTRNMAAGPIKAGGSRVFHAAGPASFADQGGSATDCGVASRVPAAVVLTITVVSPTSAGYASVRPADAPPLASASLTYAAGDVVTTTLITATSPDVAQAAANVALETLARADYVIELVGYFAPAGERLVSCQEWGARGAWVFPGETVSVTADACDDNFGAAATNCEVSANARLLHSANGTCRVRNDGAWFAQVVASHSCCRVPGR